MENKKRTLVRWDCGCIGLYPREGDTALIIRPCDDDDWQAPLAWFFRRMENKSFEVLSEEEEKVWFEKIREAFSDASALKTIRRLLVPR